jgi:hypothetical protein
VQGKTDADNSLKGNTLTYGADSCMKRTPNVETDREARNFCVAWALGYAVGWREITGVDIDLPPPFPQPEQRPLQTPTPPPS